MNTKNNNIINDINIGSLFLVGIMVTLITFSVLATFNSNLSFVNASNDPDKHENKHDHENHDENHNNHNDCNN